MSDCKIQVGVCFLFLPRFIGPLYLSFSKPPRISRIAMQKRSEQEGLQLHISATDSLDERTRDVEIHSPENKPITSMVVDPGKERNWDRVLEAFALAKKPNTVVYNAVFGAALKCGHFEDGLRFYQDMCSSGHLKTEITYSAVIRLLGKSGRYQEAKEVWREFKGYGFSGDVQMSRCYSAILDAAAQVGNVGDCRRLLTEMKSCNAMDNPLITLAICMNACKNAGDPASARHFLQEMKQGGVQAENPIIYTSAMAAFRGEPLSQLCALEAEMLANGIQPHSAFVEAHVTSILTHSFLKTTGMQEVVDIVRAANDEQIQAVFRVIARARYEGCELKPIVQRVDCALRKLDSQISISAASQVDQLGLSITNFPPKKVSVKRVEAGGWADMIGLTPGDVILALNGLPADHLNAADFKNAMGARPLCLKVMLQ